MSIANFASRYVRTQQYSITALTDSSGTIKERYAYDAYGNLSIFDAAGTARTTTAESNRYAYTGREYDDILDLYHYRARMYDATVGRFCSRDPIGYEGSRWSLFCYCGSDPLNHMDPEGLVVCGPRTKLCFDAAVAAATNCLAAGGSLNLCRAVAAATYSSCLTFVLGTAPWGGL